MAGGVQLGVATLNVPGTLNSLSLEMIDLLRPKLAGWAARADDVGAVLFKGAGGRAFCAGGDIQALYHAIRENHAAGEVVNSATRSISSSVSTGWILRYTPSPNR